MIERDNAIRSGVLLSITYDILSKLRAQNKKTVAQWAAQGAHDGGAGSVGDGDEEDGGMWAHGDSGLSRRRRGGGYRRGRAREIADSDKGEDYTHSESACLANAGDATRLLCTVWSGLMSSAGTRADSEVRRGSATTRDRWLVLAEQESDRRTRVQA